MVLDPYYHDITPHSHLRIYDGPEFIATAVRKWLTEAKVIVEQWRLEYNNKRPHSSLGSLTPSQFAASCAPAV